MTYTGSCYCKNVTFEIRGQPVIAPLICYCEHCVKLSGSMGVVVGVYLPSDIEIKGELTKLVEHDTDSKQAKPIYKCKKCGSFIYTQPELYQDSICLSTSLIDGGLPEELYPQWESSVKNKPKYLQINSLKEGAEPQE